jgi:Ca-activated chloride channel homolog
VEGPDRGRHMMSGRFPMKKGLGTWRLLPVFIIAAWCATAQCDELHSKNKSANKLYEKGKYEEALKAYDNLLLEFPSEQKLKMNKGSAQYRLGQFDKAEESYNAAGSVKDKRALADLYHNLGNALYMQGDQLSASGNNAAMEKYKAALENYIKALDLRPSDRDTKWNTQLVQKKIKQMEQQQKQQQNNKDNKQDQNKKDQDKQQQNQNQDKQDKNKDNQDKNKDQNKDQQKKDRDKQQQNQDKQQQQQAKNDEKQKPEPTPQEKKQEEMKKEEAKRLIEQFSDDDKDLNKKPEKVGVRRDKNVEKDW